MLELRVYKTKEKGENAMKAEIIGTVTHTQANLIKNKICNKYKHYIYVLFSYAK